MIALLALLLPPQADFVSKAVKSLDQPSIGVTLLDVSSAKDVLTEKAYKELASSRKRSGVVVLYIKAKSPAATAGLKQGDIILGVDRDKVRSLDEFGKSLAKLKPSDSCDVFISRSFKPKRGAVVWKRKKVRVRPRPLRDIYLSQMLKEKDEVTGTERYRHSQLPKYVNERTALSPVFTTKSGRLVAARLRFQYTAADWLFISTITVKADDVTIQLTPRDVERDHSGGKIWEWCNVDLAGVNAGLLDKIANANSVTVRFTGSQYKKDFKVPMNDRLALREAAVTHKILLKPAKTSVPKPVK